MRKRTRKYQETRKRTSKYQEVSDEWVPDPTCSRSHVVQYIPVLITREELVTTQNGKFEIQSGQQLPDRRYLEEKRVLTEEGVAVTSIKTKISGKFTIISFLSSQ